MEGAGALAVPAEERARVDRAHRGRARTTSSFARARRPSLRSPFAIASRVGAHSFPLQESPLGREVCQERVLDLGIRGPDLAEREVQGGPGLLSVVAGVEREGAKEASPG